MTGGGGMSCERRRDLMMAYAAEALDPAERDETAAHLATGCPRCIGGLAEAEAVLGALPLALDPVAPPAAVRAALMRRVAASPRSAAAPRTDAAVRRTDPVAPPRHRGWIGEWMRPALAAAAAALLAAVALTATNERGRSALLARLEAQDREIVRLHEAVEAASETVRVLRSPAVRVVALAGTESQPQAAARIFWDPARRNWHFYAAALRAPGPGRTYQLWFITPAQEKISAGTFDVDPHGEAALQVEIPPGLEAIALAAVTDEPAGGSPQPTGSIHLVGATAPASS
jgi:anti-sigma-K factor RskA